MARKNDILDIYTKEVEGIKEAGLFKGEAWFNSSLITASSAVSIVSNNPPFASKQEE